MLIVAFSFGGSLCLGLMCSGLVSRPAGRRVEAADPDPEAEQKLESSPLVLGRGADELFKRWHFSEL